MWLIHSMNWTTSLALDPENFPETVSQRIKVQKRGGNINCWNPENINYFWNSRSFKVESCKIAFRNFQRTPSLATVFESFIMKDCLFDQCCSPWTFELSTISYSEAAFQISSQEVKANQLDWRFKNFQVFWNREFFTFTHVSKLLSSHISCQLQLIISSNRSSDNALGRPSLLHFHRMEEKTKVLQ